MFAKPSLTPIALRTIRAGFPFHPVKEQIMSYPTIITALALAALCGSAQAEDKLVPASIIARQKNCIACHKMDERLVGPAYTSIAAQYTLDDIERVANSIKKGSKGLWGTIPMAPNHRVSDDEALQLAQWIITMDQSVVASEFAQNPRVEDASY